MRAFGQTSESAGDRRRAEAKLGERGGDVAVQFVVVEASAHRASDDLQEDVAERPAAEHVQLTADAVEVGRPLTRFDQAHPEVV